MTSHSPASTALDPRDQRIAELEARVAELQQKLADLQAQLAEVERAGKRQATPFARKKHKEHRKRPGRKAGQGQFAWRVRPIPEQVTATKEAPLRGCPECGGRLRARYLARQAPAHAEVPMGRSAGRVPATAGMAARPVLSRTGGRVASRVGYRPRSRRRIPGANVSARRRTTHLPSGSPRPTRR